MLSAGGISAGLKRCVRQTPNTFSWPGMPGVATVIDSARWFQTTLPGPHFCISL